MQTQFSIQQLADPKVAQADEILRKCVHCGFCLSSCPTYAMTGDERDSPRGRIWMMREVLSAPDTISSDTSYHIDRCLGCLACESACPSGVDYGHLLDIGREKLGDIVPRRLLDKVMRWLLSVTVPHATRFRAMIMLGRLGWMLTPFMPQQMRAAMQKLPRKLPKIDQIGATSTVYPTKQKTIKRVILLAGCAQRALDPEINASTLRVLDRLGVEVVVRQEAHCCGALAHHIGNEKTADHTIRAAILAWHDEIQKNDVDAIIANASGCGTMIKDYGHMMSDDPALCAIAKSISTLAMDITELLAQIGIENIIEPAPAGGRGKLAYHSACSLQHGQKIHDMPQHLLRQAGFDIVQPPEPHMCCGSAGVYNILQSEMANGLKQRKLENLKNTKAQFVAAGNIGCISQLNSSDQPVRHTIQFIDWASGGPPPFAD